MQLRVVLATLAALLATAAASRAQPPDPSRKWEIVDNSFLVEESFNQERGVFQNIFTWTRERGGAWQAAFTQEWPAPGVTHQLSFTLPYASNDRASGVGDVLVNYRFQARGETDGGPAISPRLSVILPTGRADLGLGDGGVGLE